MALFAAFLAAQLPAPVADIPFEHEPGRIWLRAKLNGTPVYAVLDTGSSATVMAEELVAPSGATKAEEIRIGGNAGTTVGWKLQGARLTLDRLDVELDVPFAAALPSVPRKALSSHPIQVILGTDFMKRYLVEIDYPRSHVRLYDPQVASLVPSLNSAPIRLIDGKVATDVWLTLPGRDDEWVSAEIDSGVGAGLLVTNRTVQKQGLAARFAAASRTQVWMGIGGEVSVAVVPEAKGRLPFGPFASTALLVLSEPGLLGIQSPYDVVLGDDVLRRFDLIFDVAGGRLSLRGP